jgi:hypothetical protein
MFNSKFYNDANDKEITMRFILPNIISNYEETLIPTYKYHKIDCYVVTSTYNEDLIPIEIKNKLKYSINDYDTLSIDTETYSEITNKNGYLIVFYPTDRKVLIFNSDQMKKAFDGFKSLYVTSYSEKNDNWYKEYKTLSYLKIKEGTTYDYKDFNL